MNRRLLISLLVCLATVALAAVCWFFYSRPQPLTIELLDIGQGDSIYLRTPAGNDIVIDGGPDRSVLAQLGAVMRPWDHTIELVIATHPDADHITGITALPEAYTINTLITNGKSKGTAASKELDSWPDTYHLPMLHPLRGDRLDIEPDVWLEFLHPTNQTHEDGNDDSVVCILHYKNFTALFTGDASQQVEAEILRDYPQFGVSSLDVDLLKVSHHGSHTGSSRAWIDALTPQIGLIGVGKDNRYGHPHANTLWRLQQAGVQIFRTDQDGRVSCTSWGQGVECSP